MLAGRKYYSWIEKDPTEKKSEELDEESCRYSIDKFRSFSVLYQSILKNWVDYLTSLETKLDEGKVEEVISIFKNMFRGTEAKPFQSVAFYTSENALKLYELLYEVYNKVPDEVKSQKEENPYFGGMTILPIKLILDSLYPIDKEEWRS